METLTAQSKAEILLVDDVSENLTLLSIMLKKAGYQTVAVNSGRLALEVSKVSSPDLIMMDITMPEMDGYETCQQLKSDPRTRHIPVLFISALGDVEDKVKAFRTGGVDYVTKPFQIEEVLARIETHLSIRRLQQQLEFANAGLQAHLEEIQRAQASEHSQRMLAETLAETAAAISSSLDFNEVLDLILDNIARVVPHTSSNVALLDEQGRVNIRRAHGYQERDLQDLVLNIQLPYQHFPAWRKVVEDRQPVVITEAVHEQYWTEMPGFAWVRSCICAPIISKDAVLGIINLESDEQGYFTAEQARRLKSFADQAAMAIEKARLFEQVQRLAITDDLTGVYNRRHLLFLAQKEYKRYLRYRHPLSVMMIDIDRFKRVNDTYGHPTGDQALITLTNCCKNNMRTTDNFGRYGGEEFLALLPETDSSQAREVAERLRKEVEAQVIPTPKGPLQITVSIGIFSLENGIEMDLDQVLVKADDALYAAKDAGRNRICQ